MQTVNRKLDVQKLELSEIRMLYGSDFGTLFHATLKIRIQWNNLSQTLTSLDFTSDTYCFYWNMGVWRNLLLGWAKKITIKHIKCTPNIVLNPGIPLHATLRCQLKIKTFTRSQQLDTQHSKTIMWISPISIDWQYCIIEPMPASSDERASASQSRDPSSTQQQAADEFSFAHVARK